MFSILNNDNRERFFEKSFLLADVKLDIILKMSFLIMTNVDINFQVWNLQWRSYTTEDIFLTTKCIKLMEKKKFAAIAFDLKYKAFIIYIAVFNVDLNDKVHLSTKA